MVVKKRYLLTNKTYSVFYNVVDLLGELWTSTSHAKSSAIVYLSHELPKAKEALWRAGYESPVLKEVTKDMVPLLLDMQL